MKVLKRIFINNLTRNSISQLIENDKIELLEEYNYPEGTAIWVLINKGVRLNKKITIKESQRICNQRKDKERKDVLSKHKAKINRNKKINELFTTNNEYAKSGQEKKLHRIVLREKGQKLIIPMIDSGLIELIQEFRNYHKVKVYWIMVNKVTLHMNPFLTGVREEDNLCESRIAKEQEVLLEKFAGEGIEGVIKKFNIRVDSEIKYLSKDNLGTLSNLKCNENNKKLIGKIITKDGTRRHFVCNSFKFHGLDTFEIYKGELSSSNTQKVLYDVMGLGILGGAIANIRVYSECGISSEDNGKIGFKDADNNWVIEPEFDLCTLEERKYLGYYIFNPSNISKVRLENKDALIKKDGQYLVPPFFDKLLNIDGKPKKPFCRGITFIYNKSFVNVMKDGLVGVYDIERQDLVIPVIFNEISINFCDIKNHVYVMKDGLVGIYDIKSKDIVVPVIFNKISTNFCNTENYVNVMKDGFVGIYDIRSQEVVVPPIFDKILSKSDLSEIPFNKKAKFIYQGSYVFVMKDQLLGIYDIKKQKLFLETVYRNITYNKLSDNTCVFKCYKDNTCDLVDKYLELVITDIDNVRSYDCGYFEMDGEVILTCFYIVSKAGKYGVLEDEMGDLLIPFDYQYINQLISSSKEGTTLFVAKNNNFYGVINHRNELVLNFEYDNIIGVRSRISEEVQYKVVKNGETLLIDSEGKKIISLDKFDDKEKIDYVMFSEELAVLREDGKYGYANSDGEWVIKPQFLSGGQFKNGRANVAVKTSFCNNAKGIIDNRGRFIEGPTCNCSLPDSKGRFYL